MVLISSQISSPTQDIFILPDLYIDDELKQQRLEDFKNAKDEVDVMYPDDDDFDK